MFWELLIVYISAFPAFGQTPPHTVSSDEYLLGIHKLFPALNSINGFDEPYHVSNARISTPVNVKLPSVEQMMYYNYYAAAVNCPYQVHNLSCHYCPKIKGDIQNYIILENATHDTGALIALSEKRKEIVIAFRSTENMWNWVLDFLLTNVTPDPRKDIKIHRGFYIATMSLYKDVVKTVGSFRMLKGAYKTYKIVLTGHSLGGAMARVTEFFLIYLNQFHGLSIEVYTYGEPRSGNKHYVDYLNSQNVTSARIVNRADLASHAIPTSILGTNIFSDSYYHVLNEYWINGDKSKFCDQFVYEDRTCSNSLGPLYTFFDHFSFFDVTHAYCLSDIIEEFTAIPNVIVPVKDVPPFPRNIQILIEDISAVAVKILSPVIG